MSNFNANNSPEIKACSVSFMKRAFKIWKFVYFAVDTA